MLSLNEQRMGRGKCLKKLKSLLNGVKSDALNGFSGYESCVALLAFVCSFTACKTSNSGSSNS